MVSGINVGAQSYWNAEATMLGHHKGMLIMLPDQAMVLTGKRRSPSPEAAPTPPTPTSAGTTR